MAYWYGNNSEKISVNFVSVNQEEHTGGGLAGDATQNQEGLSSDEDEEDGPGVAFEGCVNFLVISQ